MPTAAHLPDAGQPLYQLTLTRIAGLTGRRLTADETVQLATYIDLLQYASFTGPERADIADQLRELGRLPGQARIAIAALRLLFT